MIYIFTVIRAGSDRRIIKYRAGSDRRKLIAEIIDCRKYPTDNKVKPKILTESDSKYAKNNNVCKYGNHDAGKITEIITERIITCVCKMGDLHQGSLIKYKRKAGMK